MNAIAAAQAIALAATAAGRGAVGQRRGALGAIGLPDAVGRFALRTRHFFRHALAFQILFDFAGREIAVVYILR